MTTTGEQALAATKDTPLPALATQINDAHEHACRAAQSAIAHARRAGDLLIEAKAEVEHGSWLSWLGEHCHTISKRTAQAYMRVARDWPILEAKAQRVADLPLRDALALLSERADSQVEDDGIGQLNLDERNNWTAEFRAWVELIEGVRKTVTEVD